MYPLGRVLLYLRVHLYPLGRVHLYPLSLPPSPGPPHSCLHPCLGTLNLHTIPNHVYTYMFLLPTTLALSTQVLPSPSDRVLLYPALPSPPTQTHPPATPPSMHKAALPNHVGSEKAPAASLFKSVALYKGPLLHSK